MDKFFNPKSIAVIGVSEKPSNLAKNILTNLEEFAYEGLIYAVGHKGGIIHGRKIYKSVLEIQDNIDLAVILTPADTIPAIMEECGKKGIKNVVVESAGFREYGEAGREREKKLTAVTEKYGIKFIGPNCIGLMNLQNGLILPFLLFKNIYTRGKVALVTQSGGVGISLLYRLAEESIGIGKFASIGNKLNIDENDVIEYLLNDDETDTIIVYLEGISNGRRLMELAMNSNKPILLYKANTGTLAQSIASSHTAALSSDDAVVDAALKQAGIARFKDRYTLVNYLKVLPLPRLKGNKLAILSRSGGHAILAADSAEDTGLELAPFKKSFIKEIEKHFRANVINLTNPLDLGDLFDYDVYLKIIERTAKEKDVDGVVFLHTYFSAIEGEASRKLIEKTRELSEKYKKPIGVCVVTDGQELYKLRRELKQPVFDSPLEIIKSLALVKDFDYGRRPKEKLPALRVNRENAAKIMQKCKKESRSPLLQEGLDIFAAYGIPTVKSIWVQSRDEAVRAADAMGYPVVLKVVSREISHKTDIGGVELNLKNAVHVKDAYEEMMATIRKKMPKAKIEGVVVQPMMKRKWEMILGAKRDPNFGPTIMVGLGGIFVEIFKDTSIRVCPISEKTAGEMLTDLKGYPVLTGARGGDRYDIGSITNGLLRLSRLISDFPEIKEIDVNPFVVMIEGEGGVALDARIVL